MKKPITVLSRGVFMGKAGFNRVLTTGHGIQLLLCLAAAAVSMAFTEGEVELFQRQSVAQGNLHIADSVIISGSVEDLDFMLSEFQVAGLDAQQLMLLRNSIFAKYGYIFDDDSLLDHFESFSWYSPDSDDVSDFLDPVDERNIRLILFYESMINTSNTAMPEEEDMVGFWHGSAAVGSGYSRRFFFFADGGFIFRENSMDGSRRLREISGEWELDGGHLVLNADSMVYMEGGRIAEPYASYGSDFILEDETETRVELSTRELFRMPVGDFTRNYAADYEESGLDHLTVPYMSIGRGDYWRICSDPYAEHLM